MFKTCEKLVNLSRKTCEIKCEKLWVNFIKKLPVGKSTILNTVLPTHFSQLFFTHLYLLKLTPSPLSTAPITTIKYIIRKDFK